MKSIIKNKILRGVFLLVLLSGLLSILGAEASNGGDNRPETGDDRRKGKSGTESEVFSSSQSGSGRSDASGKKRNFDIRRESNGRRYVIRGRSKNATVKTGYFAVFEVNGAPSFGYRFYSKMEDVTGSSDDSAALGVSYEGARISFVGIREIDSSNQTIANCSLGRNGAAWSAINATKTATTDGSTYVSAQSSASFNVTNRGTVSVILRIDSSLDDNTTAVSLGLEADSLKWSVTIAGWSKASGNRLVLDHFVRSTGLDFADKASALTGGSVQISYGASKFKWADTVVLDDARAANLKLFDVKKANSTELENEVEGGKQGGEKSAAKVSVVIDTTEAFSKMYWDPSVGSSEADGLDGTSSGSGTSTGGGSGSTTSAAAGLSLSLAALSASLSTVFLCINAAFRA